MMAHRPRPRRPPRALGSGRRWIIVGLVVFVLADIVLVALAFAAHRSEGPREHGPIPTFSSAPDTPATPVPTTTSAAASHVTPLGSPRFLLATSATEAWRASSGSCTGASAVLEHTTDAGATWRKVRSGDGDIGEVLALGGNSARTWIAGTGGGACAPHFYASYTMGRFWSEYAEELPAVAYIDTAADAHGDTVNYSLHLPSGVEDAPCEHPQRVVVAPATAALCPGALYEQDAAGSWTSVPVAGIQAMAGSDSGYTLAVSGVNDCDGLAIESLATPAAANEQPKELGCVAGEPADGVALDRNGDSLWLWNGSSVSVSADGGAHWR